MDIREVLHSGELYLPHDEEILKEQFVCLDRGKCSDHAGHHHRR